MIFTKDSQNFDFQTGQIILIDKPLDWTSFDVVNKLKHATKAKTGHAGTLDPLATGLVILCTGKFTKRIQELQDQEKEYTGTICLGATRPSYDQETAIDQLGQLYRQVGRHYISAFAIMAATVAAVPIASARSASSIPDASRATRTRRSP